jgi:hypothetical protein
MADVASKHNTPLAAILFRREALIFLITLVCSLIIFIVMLRFIFQSMWDQATQAVRVEIEKEADTIARLLVFEFSHLTELETQAPMESTFDERIKRLLWEKVTFNETIRGIELIPRRSEPSGQYLTYTFFPSLSHRESESEQGPQKALKSFSGLEGDLIRIINREQRVDKNLLDSINHGRKLESEMILRYFPLYIPLPDQGAIYWGVVKVGINTDALRRFLVLLEDEKEAVRLTLALAMGGVIAFALALGLLGFRWISRKTAAPLTTYGMMNTALADGVEVDIESLLAHLQQQEPQGILEFDQLQSFCLRLSGTIQTLGERLIDAERQACAGRLAARLVAAGGGECPGPGLQNLAGLFTPLAKEWREVDLEPYVQQLSNYVKAVLPQGSSLIEARQPISPLHGNEANLVQAIAGLVDFTLQEMAPGGQFHWRVFPRQAGGIYLELSFVGHNYRQEDISALLQPFKLATKNLPPLGPWLAAGIAHQHGGTLVLQSNPGGGLHLRLEIPDSKGTSMDEVRGENSEVS